MAEFEVKGQQYRSGKLDAFKQFHVSRRLVPVMSSMAGQSSMDGFVKSISNAIAGMSDGDCDYILNTALSVVQRQQGQSWAKVFDDRSRSLMFDDIDMGAMIAIAQNVLQDNLTDFFRGGLAPQAEAQAAP
ncbi:hypothetical protein FHW84_001832 [Dyella sp. SG562]|uniref:phage tail assembly chaperone n=1 Tax=Dyella sp. SG562 TaxID=2587017 RepID=UPI001421AF46|nr:hypothetical protein [Dyella sp. SG562]NII73263.1 hypothetical protein [Dyella sp. SG562]